MKLFKKKKKKVLLEQKTDVAIKCIRKLNKTMEEYYREDVLFKRITKGLKYERKRI